MGRKERVVTPAEENALRRQFDEALWHILLDRSKYEATKAFLQIEVINPHQEGQARDLAEERRSEIEGFYRDLGYSFDVPKPSVSNREFNRRREAGQELHYRPSKKELTYEAFMHAVGQGEHWTVADVAERKKIRFEAANNGYWFWADVQPSCPRLSTTWNDLTGSIRLLSLEEYVIVWWATKSLTGLVLDIPTWCWLRTRYKTDDGLGALNANEYNGQVNVNRNEPQNLSVPNEINGGRVSEALRNGKRPSTSSGRFLYGSSPNFFRVFFRHAPNIRPISCRRS